MNRMLYTYGAIVSAGAIAFAGYELIDWRCLTATEWAAWVGAIGTILAFAGTIWVATNHARKQALETRQMAELYAASFVPRIALVEDNVKELRYVLASEMTDIKDYGAIANRLRRIVTWTPDELVHLVPLGENAAVKLASAVSNIAIAIHLLDTGWMQCTRDSDWDEYHQAMTDVLGEIYHQLDHGCIVCKKACKGLTDVD